MRSTYFTLVNETTSIHYKADGKRRQGELGYSASRLLCFVFRRALIWALSFMTRLEGQKPNAGAIIIGAIIFSLIAAGLFFAFRPVPEPTDAGLSNSADTAETAENSVADADATTRNDESANSLATILTPLPLATPAVVPAATPAVVPTNDSAATPAEALADTNSATVDNSVTAPVAASTEAAPAITDSVAPPVAP